MYTPNIITFNYSKFIISHYPSILDMQKYIYTLTKYNTKYLVKLCYNTECSEYLPDNNYFERICKNNGIVFIHMPKKDGEVPNKEQFQTWKEICDKTFIGNKSKNVCDFETVGVFCMSGLGRAPTITALYLIDKNV